MPVSPNPIHRRRSPGHRSRRARHLGWLWGLAVSIVLAEGLGLTEGVVDWVSRHYGVAAGERVEQLRELVERQRAAAESVQVERVNAFFNAVPYDTDDHLWHENDYWATPVEMLSIDGADCEDYAIAKYFTLRELGVPAERLRITYVKAVKLDQAHMVLAYYAEPDGEPLILDNLDGRIRPAGARDDLVPVYSFNGEDLWLAVNRNHGRKVGTADRIDLWNRLRAKMAREGQS